MLLRPRQKVLVERARTALDQRGNTLAVAPTGAGKTVMLSALTGSLVREGRERAIILQHRDELTSQNRATFHKVNPDIRSSGVIDAANKDWHYPVSFAMVQTLVRNLQYLPPHDLVIVDEAHHVTARTYGAILDRLQELNPGILISGFTATAQRGDRTPLRKVFDNVCDQITLEELIRAGVLVRPRFFVVDIGVQEDLSNVRKLTSDFDMSEVAKIMDQRPLNTQIVEKWKEHAGERQTVVFCSTVEHATHVLEAFREAGVTAAMIEAATPKAERARILKDFDACHIQVVCNVAVLTEGWDCQPVSCVILLRPSSFKSTMIQMVGRGLRRLDPEKHPGRHKNDCMVLDFGTSVLMHGTLEMDADLDPQQANGEAPTKECPECGGEVPLAVMECPLCGYVFPSPELEGGGGPDEGLVDFVLREIDIFNASPFKWEEFWNGVALIANGFDAWGMVIWYGGEWQAVCGARSVGLRHLASGEKILCLSAADDFIRENEQEGAAHKSRRWLRLPATEKQLALLGIPPMQAMGISRYQASCLLTWKFNEGHVRRKLADITKEAA